MHISARERAILELLVRGLSNKEIGSELSLSEQTVKNYLFKLNGKMGTRDRVGLALTAVASAVVTNPHR